MIIVGKEEDSMSDCGLKIFKSMMGSIRGVEGREESFDHIFEGTSWRRVFKADDNLMMELSFKDKVSTSDSRGIEGSAIGNDTAFR